MILFVLVGGVFAIFGGALLYVRSYFLKYASKVWGKVVAIEKRMSTHRSGNSRESSITYAPIVEYIFNGEPILFSSGGSSNNIYKYKINDRVRVLSLDKGPEYVMLEKGVLGTMGRVFFIVGLVFCGIGFYNLFQKSASPTFSWFSELAFLLLLAPGAFIVSVKIRQYFKDHDVKLSELMLKSAKLETRESLEGREVYWSKQALEKELASVTKVGLIVSLVFFVGALVGLYFTWNALPVASKNLLSGLLENSGNFQQVLVLVQRKDPKIIGFLIALFFSLAGTYSLVFSMKKLN